MLNRRVKTLHKPGVIHQYCSFTWCDGIGVWTPDPFTLEIYGVEEFDWFCDGMLYASGQEI